MALYFREIIVYFDNLQVTDTLKADVPTDFPYSRSTNMLSDEQLQDDVDSKGQGCANRSDSQFCLHLGNQLKHISTTVMASWPAARFKGRHLHKSMCISVIIRPILFLLSQN